MRLAHRGRPFDAAVALFLADADAVVLLQVASSCGRERSCQVLKVLGLLFRRVVKGQAVFSQILF